MSAWWASLMHTANSVRPGVALWIKTLTALLHWVYIWTGWACEQCAYACCTRWRPPSGRSMVSWELKKKSLQAATKGIRFWLCCNRPSQLNKQFLLEFKTDSRQAISARQDAIFFVVYYCTFAVHWNSIPYGTKIRRRLQWMYYTARIRLEQHF